MNIKEKIIEALDKNPINTIEQAIKFLSENGIEVNKHKKRWYKRKRWVLSFPYQDLDFAIPNDEGLITFCIGNKEQIKSKYEKWKQFK